MITPINCTRTYNASFGKKENKIVPNTIEHQSDTETKPSKKKSKLGLWLAGIGAAALAFLAISKSMSSTKTNKDGDSFESSPKKEEVPTDTSDTSETANNSEELIKDTAGEKNATEEITSEEVISIPLSDAIIEEATSEGVIGETVGEEATSKSVNNSEEIAEEAVGKENPTKDTAGEEVIEETANNKNAIEDTTGEEVIEETANNKNAIEDTTGEEVIEDTTGEEVIEDTTGEKEIQVPQTATTKREDRAKEIQTEAQVILEDATNIVSEAKDEFNKIQNLVRNAKKLAKSMIKNNSQSTQLEDGSTAKFLTVEDCSGKTSAIMIHDKDGNFTQRIDLEKENISEIKCVNPETKMVDLIELDSKGILYAKNCDFENNQQVDKLYNFEYAQEKDSEGKSFGKLLEYAENLTVNDERGRIGKAYKYDENQILKSCAKGLSLNGEETGYANSIFKFNNGDLEERSGLYIGSLVGETEGISGRVYQFENGEFTGYQPNKKDTVDVLPTNND